MKKIFLVTNATTGQKTSHGSVVSFLEHPDCLKLSRLQFYQKYGANYPIRHKNFLIEQIEHFSASESRRLETESRIL
jgi:hypothetical protein